ncbi:MAG: hypothetical protein JXR95_12860 [Deltaproteobacteria bacterium]|nr:hypothetical protein [Deltaproteobacteria bacterium]
MKISGNIRNEPQFKSGWYLSMFTLFWLLTAAIRFLSYISGYRSRGSFEKVDDVWHFTRKTTLFGIIIEDLKWIVSDSQITNVSEGKLGDSSFVIQGIILMLYLSFIGILRIFSGITLSNSTAILTGAALVISGIFFDIALVAAHTIYVKRYGYVKIFRFSDGTSLIINPDTKSDD